MLRFFQGLSRWLANYTSIFVIASIKTVITVIVIAVMEILSQSSSLPG